jgi:hypothetical protein
MRRLIGQASKAAYPQHLQRNPQDSDLNLVRVYVILHVLVVTVTRNRRIRTRNGIATKRKTNWMPWISITSNVTTARRPDI